MVQPGFIKGSTCTVDPTLGLGATTTCFFTPTVFTQGHTLVLHFSDKLQHFLWDGFRGGFNDQTVTKRASQAELKSGGLVLVLGPAWTFTPLAVLLAEAPFDFLVIALLAEEAGAGLPALVAGALPPLV